MTVDPGTQFSSSWGLQSLPESHDVSARLQLSPKRAWPWILLIWTPTDVVMSQPGLRPALLLWMCLTDCHRAWYVGKVVRKQLPFDMGGGSNT